MLCGVRPFSRCLFKLQGNTPSATRNEVVAKTSSQVGESL